MDIDEMFENTNENYIMNLDCKKIEESNKFIETLKETLSESSINSENDNVEIKKLKYIISELHSFNLDICSTNTTLKKEINKLKIMISGLNLNIKKLNDENLSKEEYIIFLNGITSFSFILGASIVFLSFSSSILFFDYFINT